MLPKQKAKIMVLAESHFPLLFVSSGGSAWNVKPEKWQRYFFEQQNGQRHVVLIGGQDKIFGYGSLLWQSQYPSFQSKKIPEINDLVVAEAERCQGYATQLIHYFEQLATSRGYERIGLGVGLYADYGAAQKLYIKMGYVPDGRGITYNNVTLAPGSASPLDDDLILWLTKKI